MLKILLLLPFLVLCSCESMIRSSIKMKLRKDGTYVHANVENFEERW